MVGDAGPVCGIGDAVCGDIIEVSVEGVGASRERRIVGDGCGR